MKSDRQTRERNEQRRPALDSGCNSKGSSNGNSSNTEPVRSQPTKAERQRGEIFAEFYSHSTTASGLGRIVQIKF